MTKTIKTLGDNPSKADEIAFFESVAGSIPKESYLHELFTQNFNLWVTTSIRDDANTDIYEEWQAEATAANSLNSTLVRSSEQIKHLNEEIIVFQQSANAMRKQIVDFQTTVTTMREAVNGIACERDNALAQLDMEKAYRADENKLRHEYLAEMDVMKKMLIAVVDDTSDEDMKIAARMLVFGWKR